MAATSRIGLELVASEPVVPPARLSRLAVRVVSTGLARDIGAVEDTVFEAVLCRLLLGIGRQVSRCQKLVDQVLVLADAI